MRIVLVLAVVAAIAGSGCQALGFTDRVLHRVPSPDGQVIAVCQEIPAFDGPGYEVRLERPDGTLVRLLSRIGDGAPCDEVVWSADGRLLAVLTGYTAGIAVADVRWALEHIAEQNSHWFLRTFSYSTDTRRVSSGIEFVSPRELSFRFCVPEEAERDNTIERCPPSATTKRLTLPDPFVANRPS